MSIRYARFGAAGKLGKLVPDSVGERNRRTENAMGCKLSDTEAARRRLEEIERLLEVLN